jgi:hypothetical protein
MSFVGLWCRRRLRSLTLLSHFGPFRCECACVLLFPAPIPAGLVRKVNVGKPPLMSADNDKIYLQGAPVEGGRTRKIGTADLGGQHGTWRFGAYSKTREHHPKTAMAAISAYNGPLFAHLQKFRPAPVAVTLPKVETEEQAELEVKW